MLICQCKGLTESQIRDLIRQGWNSMELLEVATGVGAECGGCWEGLLCLLDDEIGTDQQAELAQPA